MIYEVRFDDEWCDRQDTRAAHDRRIHRHVLPQARSKIILPANSKSIICRPARYLSASGGTGIQRNNRLRKYRSIEQIHTLQCTREIAFLLPTCANYWTRQCSTERDLLDAMRIQEWSILLVVFQNMSSKPVRQKVQQSNT